MRRLLIEEGADIAKELYVGMVVDRHAARRADGLSEGGMDIEEVAVKTPEKIDKVFVDPVAGLTDGEARAVAKKIGMPGCRARAGERAAARPLQCFFDTDASLLE